MEGLHEKVGMETSSQGDEEYQNFLEDLEEDPELRQNVNIYKDKRKFDALVDGSEADDVTGDTPQISLAEMLDDLVLSAPVGAGDVATEMDDWIWLFFFMFQIILKIYEKIN